MNRGWSGFRRARWGAVCTLALMCACLTVGTSAQQDATTAPKKTTSKAGTHHESASTPSAASSSTHTGSKTRSRKRKSARVRGQQKIDSERARSIQEALIREHYMTGEATGTWNPASEEAMRKYQADHGWQSKQVPDSRALIKLGLGPSNDHLLNPESAMITGPDAPRAESIPTTSHTAAPTADPSPAQPNHNDSSSPQ
jgi:peptidoglycan hydrolase-like protein with peptidoglycan-binding domain